MPRIHIHIERARRGHHGNLFTYEGTVGGDRFEDVVFSFGASGAFLARPPHEVAKEVAERDSTVREIVEEAFAAGGSVVVNGKAVDADAYADLTPTQAGWKTP